MTAEIAILNRQAVALAADSAVTIGRRRAWKTANKLFSLSPANDIGIMIYGSGDFVGFSWEIVAKTFREHVGSRVFATVSECGIEFLQYLRENHFEEEDPEDLNVLALFYEVLEDVKEEVGEHKSKLDYRKKLTDVIGIRIKWIDANVERLDAYTEKKKFLADYSARATEFADETFDCLITSRLHKLINDLLYLAFCSAMESSLSTGVVLAGYGKDQYFPELIDYKVDGKHRGFVRVWMGRKEDLNEEGAPIASVVPFAQSDMFQLFMEGITRNHLSFMNHTLIRVLNDKSARLVEKFIANADERRTELKLQRKNNRETLKDFFEEFANYIQQEMVQPVVGVISTLPKEEMAAMAEALVEITTLRRKVDSAIESVGGPTDVAIISKGDGLVWIKRKHYFDLEINRDFLRRKRFRHGGGDGA